MDIDRSIDPTAEQVRALRDAPQSGPITMVNLLKFRAEARYADDSDPPCSGREAYARYERGFKESVGALSEAQVLYQGPVDQVFIGRVGEPAADWDEVLIVRYPSRQHFLAMMADPGYRQALRHRYAALERTVLLRCAGA